MNLKENKEIYSLGLVLLVVLILTVITSNNLSKVKDELESNEKLLNESLAKYEGTTFDGETHVKEIKEGTVSARNIAKEIIDVQNVLASFYKTSDPLPEDEKQKQELFDNKNKAEEKNALILGNDADPMVTWKLNPEWKLKLESVLNYESTSHIPVVFSMTTKKDETAGLVYGIYNVEKNTLENISVNYTKNGLDDEAEIGGM